MSYFTRAIALTFLAAGGAPAQAAEPPADIAELFPPVTLAYAELRNPAEMAPQLAALFKGTVLQDSIPFIHARKDAAKTMMELNGKQHLALLGLLTSPEMLAEFKKLRVAAGLTGFTENGDPDCAIVILTDESPAAGLAARAYITMTAQLRKVGEVSKVPVFQVRAPNISYDPNGNPVVKNDQPLTDGPHELTLAYTPGLFVIGTSKTAVGHAVKRFLGEEKGGGLATTAAFKEAAAAHRKTGLFYFLNFPLFAEKYSNANKTRGGVNAALRQFTELGDTDLYEWFKMTANDKAVKTIAGCVRFRDGGISATMAAGFDPALKSPLLNFLSGPGVKVEMLHHAPRPAKLAFSVSLPEKNRAAALIELLDATAKANGVLGRLPSDVVKELTVKYKQPVADELLGKVSAITLIVPTNQELPKGGKPAPMLVFQTVDASAAAAWAEFVPKLVADLGGAAKVSQPSSETIDGVKVFSVSGSGLRWNAPVHFANHGSVVALGLDRKLVAAAVNANAAASMIGGDRIVSPPGGSFAAFGLISLGNAMVSLLDKPGPQGPVVPGGTNRVPTFPNGNPVPESWIEEVKKARKEFLTSIGTLSPASVTVRRAENELQIEVFLPKTSNGELKAIIDASANWLDKSAGLLGVDRRNDYLEIIKGLW